LQLLSDLQQQAIAVIAAGTVVDNDDRHVRNVTAVVLGERPDFGLHENLSQLLKAA
jgi:hypothetical protein